MNLAHIASKTIPAHMIGHMIGHTTLTEGVAAPLNLESDEALPQETACPLRKPGEDGCEVCE